MSYSRGVDFLEVGSKLQWLIGKVSQHSGNIDGLIQAVSSLLSKESKDKSKPVVEEESPVLKTSNINDFYSFLNSDTMHHIVKDIFARRRKKR